MEVIQLKLQARPFAGGIEWRWTDVDRTNEYELGQYRDIEFDITGAALQSIGPKKKYMARVTMDVPFEWVLPNGPQNS